MTKQEDFSVITTKVKPHERALINRAVAIVGTTVSTFMRDTLLREAKDVVIDQRNLLLDDVDWTSFTAKLDEPPEKNSRIANLLSRSAPHKSES